MMMSPGVHAIQTLLPILYLFVVCLYGMEFGGPNAPRAAGIRRATSVLLLIMHGAWLALLWDMVGHFPIVDFWTTISLLAFAVLVVYLPVEGMAKAPSTGAFVIGFAFLLQLIASCFLVTVAPSDFGPNKFFAIHIATIVLAVAALLLSGFFGALYLVLLAQIRGRHFGVLFQRLPDLETLSRLNRASATIGFVFLTIGLNAGIAWAHSGAVKDFNYLDPKVLPVVLLWVIFGVIGSSRWIRFLSGRRAAIVAVAAASLLVLAVVVSFLPLGSIHES